MKFILMSLVLFSFQAYAAEDTEHQDGPCKKIMDACKSSDFAKSEQKQKMAIYKECFQPILNGQAVAGITVEASAVSACKAKREALQQKKGK